jgi:hypothetical protein
VSKEDVDLDQDEDLEDDSASDGDSGSDNSAPPKDAAADKGSGDKRVNDLMGKWQAEEARANKLQQELDAARGKAPAADPKDKSADGEGSAPANEFLDFAREDARRRLFESEPKLAAAGLDSSAISGSTLGEMKDSLKRQKALVDGMESRLRGEVLKQHGLDPEVMAGSQEKVHGIAEMSDEKFAAFLADRDAHQYD